MERKITPGMIEATLKGGKIERFGKHNIRFIKDYKDKWEMLDKEVKKQVKG